HEAKLRGLTLSRAANDALKRVLIHDRADAIADTIKARLDRLDQRDLARGRAMAILRETLLAVVRVGFTSAGTLEREEDDDQAEALFDAFLDEVARGVRA
ncbi:MAG: hypothetical protein ACK5Z6_04445, partial [Hyphomonadaceae bacterium]